MSLPGLLFIVFLVLKLMGYISWSWWWVTAPIWGTAVLVLGFYAIAVLIAGYTVKRTLF